VLIASLPAAVTTSVPPKVDTSHTESVKQFYRRAARCCAHLSPSDLSPIRRAKAHAEIEPPSVDQTCHREHEFAMRCGRVGPWVAQTLEAGAGRLNEIDDPEQVER
jgi:hypothetical protein